MGRTTDEEESRIVICNFNSLAPCGANPHFSEVPHVDIQFQLTRPVWGEPCAACVRITLTSISTHSPRVGRTPNSTSSAGKERDFNSLAPCGANLGILFSTAECMTFQLTRPVWGEPAMGVEMKGYNENFNSLAPCGANLIICATCGFCCAFQLTRPVWGEP